MREDRTPGGKHRIKRVRLSEGGEDSSPDPQPRGLEPEHTEIINSMIASEPDRIPIRDGRLKLGETFQIGQIH